MAAKCLAVALAASLVAAPAPTLTIARLQYDGGGDWYANPSSIPNLLQAIAERTTLKVAREEARVTPMDDRLFDYPFIHATGHGTIRFSDAEAARLREYLLGGGFLHVDDNYGLDASFREAVKKIFPDRELVDVPRSHPIYHIVYDMPDGIPKIHEHDGKPARGYGIFVGDRLVLYYSYESDLGNGWEDPATYNDPPALHEAALRMGVNLFVYAVTSRPDAGPARRATR
ncbi:MAG: DUF4159 domain-containing protein [Gemmatimonadaceae bacterium]|nr:DUF4159 domain-containing protein [Gemmatimonadaceae bacterium]NUQ92719.1 DUF4159 domain-containing protein [Gemmatimonadaceae bacterium]